MNNATVLIIEDDDALRVLYQTLLGRGGYSLDCVTNGEAGLRQLRTRRYDAILLDLTLPVCSGFDVLSRLEASSPDLLRRTIVTTGVSERQLRGLDGRGVHAVIRKPFDIHHLVETVGSCVRQELETLRADASERFAKHAPRLRRLMREANGSSEELMLRVELRRLVTDLGGAFDEIATIDGGEEFAPLAQLARQIAVPPPRASRGH